MYTETKDAKDEGGEPQHYRDNWLQREPDFDKADFEAYCGIMDKVMKPSEEYLFTISFVSALLRFKP